MVCVLSEITVNKLKTWFVMLVFLRLHSVLIVHLLFPLSRCAGHDMTHTQSKSGRQANIPKRIKKTNNTDNISTLAKLLITARGDIRTRFCISAHTR